MIIGPGIRFGAGINLTPIIFVSSWDLSFATFNGTNFGIFSVQPQETIPNDVYFRDDGLKMYVVGLNLDRVYEYDLSIAWDVTSASFVQNFSVVTQEINPTGLFFKPDGTRMYVVGLTGDDVNEYDLSIAWDVATATYTQNVSVAAQEIVPNGIYFKPDGTRMYITGSTSDAVWAYDL